mmetsp:Transcript_3286/g.4610  ORF Transcript_3286/g.4610 Transcript_3286/m.4610 type:complete len:98 (-) Transcript_3286:1326-1619(-)
MLTANNTNVIKVTPYSCSFTNISRVAAANFTKKEIARTEQAKDFYVTAGMPGYKLFFACLQNSYNRNCPVTVADAKRAIAIWGKDLSYMKSRMINRR